MHVCLCVTCACVWRVCARVPLPDLLGGALRGRIGSISRSCDVCSERFGRTRDVAEYARLPHACRHVVETGTPLTANAAVRQVVWRMRASSAARDRDASAPSRAQPERPRIPRRCRALRGMRVRTRVVDDFSIGAGFFALSLKKPRASGLDVIRALRRPGATETRVTQAAERVKADGDGRAGASTVWALGLTSVVTCRVPRHTTTSKRVNAFVCCPHPVIARPRQHCGRATMTSSLWPCSRQERPTLPWAQRLQARSQARPRSAAAAAAAAWAPAAWQRACARCRRGGRQRP